MKAEPERAAWKRSKVIAMLLAVFFGPWTWLYTYRRDPGKAASGLGLNISFLMFYVAIYVQNLMRPPPAGSTEGESLGYVLVGLLAILLATWLVAIILTAVTREWYLFGSEKRNKIIAIILAVFLGPWTWLYTYKRDIWRFWPAILFGLGGGFLVGPWDPKTNLACLL